MRVASEAFDLLAAMAEHGNPASASDAGVGVLAIRAAIRGAWLNVRTNLGGADDKAKTATIRAEGGRLVAEAERRETEILGVVERRVGGGEG
jgi:glutamate formiminotransferase / formiminotetrahydrofolate cyclodeaminase